MTEKKIDAPFLSKFNRNSVYFNSDEELYKSIIDEIGNILSSKLKILNKKEKSPFGYGIRDLQSIDNSIDCLNDFKINCIEKILYYEPRIEEVYINECIVNKMNQTIEIELICKIKGKNKHLSTKISV